MVLTYKTNSIENIHLAIAFGRANGLDLIPTSRMEAGIGTAKRGANLTKSITLDVMDVRTGKIYDMKLRSDSSKNGEIQVSVEQMRVADGFIIGRYHDNGDGTITILTLMLVEFNPDGLQATKDGYVRLRKAVYCDPTVDEVVDATTGTWQRRTVCVWYDINIQPIIPEIVQVITRRFESAITKGML